MATSYLSPAVDQARANAEAKAKEASSLQSGLPKVQDYIKSKVVEAYNSNQDIIKPLDVATTDYLGAPSAARDKYQDIFNPFTRENLVSQYTNNKALPMLTYSSLLGQRQGSIADTINAGVGGYQAQATTALNDAKMAQDSYTNLADEYYKSQQLAMERQKMAAANKPNPLQEFILAKLQEQMGGSTAPTRRYENLDGTFSEQPDPNYREPTGTGGMGDMDLQTLLAYASIGEGNYTGASNILTGVDKAKADAGNKVLSVADLNKRLSDLKTLTGNVSRVDLLQGKTGGSAPDYANFQVARDFLATEVTRMYEKGVLTDKDREFYLSKFPTDLQIIRSPKAAQESVDAVISYFAKKSAGSPSGGGNFTVQDPQTGDVWEADNIDEYYDLINKGYISSQ